MHPDKTGIIVFGRREQRVNAEKELSNNPVKFDHFEMKTKVKDKWLGEILHEDGLAASVHATILDREGKVKGAIREAIAIMEDFRMQKIGGLMGGIDLWEVAIIPSLLNNAETCRKNCKIAS